MIALAGLNQMRQRLVHPLKLFDFPVDFRQMFLCHCLDLGAFTAFIRPRAAHGARSVTLDMAGQSLATAGAT